MFARYLCRDLLNMISIFQASRQLANAAKLKQEGSSPVSPAGAPAGHDSFSLLRFSLYLYIYSCLSLS